MLRIHIGSPPGRPNSVLKVSSNPLPLYGSLGFENVQDDVARAVLFGWAGAVIAIKLAAPPASLIVGPERRREKHRSRPLGC
jgi:hypothetical protein